MKLFFYKLPQNIGRIFWKYNLLWQLVAVVLTYIIVSSDFDWIYFKAAQGTVIQGLLFPAVFFGMLAPIFVPISLYAYAAMNKKAALLNTAACLAQAAGLGLLISWFYKALTGRAHPLGFMSQLGNVALSKVFKFGILRGGVFWGWPSSHTAVAFAMAAAIYGLYPKKKSLVILSFIYAFYIGFGVSVSIHWFSDFVAGAIFGTVVGVVVGKSFRSRTSFLAD